MKFQTPLFLLATLIAYVSGEAAPRSHVRDFSVEVHNSPRDAGTKDGYSHVQKRNPVLPSGKDDTKLHVWTRLDTRPKTYNPVNGGPAHDGLNQLMIFLNGRHVSIHLGPSFPNKIPSTSPIHPRGTLPGSSHD